MVAIFVAFMFVSLILTDLSVAKWKAWQAARATRRAEIATARGLEAFGKVPEGVYLSSAHTWFRPYSSGRMEMGADSLITHAVGVIGKIVLPTPGDRVTADQPLFRLERKGRSITVPSILSGKVAAVNARLIDEPGLLNSDPYGRGWICRVTVTSVGGAAPNLRFGEKASLWLQSEFARLRDFLSAQIPSDFALGATSQDGGFPTPGCLGELDDAAWNAFVAEFLKVDKSGVA